MPRRGSVLDAVWRTLAISGDEERVPP